VAGARRTQTPTKQKRAATRARENGQGRRRKRSVRPELTSAPRSEENDRWCFWPERTGQTKARLRSGPSHQDIKVLSLPTFFAPAKKVGRPPGRDPARLESTDSRGSPPRQQTRPRDRSPHRLNVRLVAPQREGPRSWPAPGEPSSEADGDTASLRPASRRRSSRRRFSRSRSRNCHHAKASAPPKTNTTSMTMSGRCSPKRAPGRAAQAACRRRRSARSKISSTRTVRW